MQELDESLDDDCSKEPDEELDELPRSYYYDDAHGYEVFLPDDDEESPDENEKGDPRGSP